MQEASRRSVKGWKGRQLVAPRARVGSLAADRPRRLPLCVPRGKQIQLRLSGRVSLAVGGGLWPVSGSWPCPRDCCPGGGVYLYQKLAHPNPNPRASICPGPSSSARTTYSTCRLYIAPGGRYRRRQDLQQIATNRSPPPPSSRRIRETARRDFDAAQCALGIATSTRQWTRSYTRRDGTAARTIFGAPGRSLCVRGTFVHARERSCRPTGH